MNTNLVVSLLVVFACLSLSMPHPVKERSDVTEQKGFVGVKFLFTSVETAIGIAIAKLALISKVFLLSIPYCTWLQATLPPTTTTTTTPMPTTTPNPKEPIICEYSNDLLVIIDSSGSIPAESYQVALEFARKLVIAWKSHLTNRVAVTIFSESVVRVLGFVESSYLTPGEINEKIRSAPQLSRGTHTHLALQDAVRQFAANDRGAPQNTVLITDGKSNHGNETKLAADELLATTSGVYAVGISAYNRPELEYITGFQQNHVFTVNKFDELLSLLYSVSKEICK